MILWFQIILTKKKYLNIGYKKFKFFLLIYLVMKIILICYEIFIIL